MIPLFFGLIIIQTISSQVNIKVQVEQSGYKLLNSTNISSSPSQWPTATTANPQRSPLWRNLAPRGRPTGYTPAATRNQNPTIARTRWSDFCLRAVQTNRGTRIRG
ncbi:hypothetical protein ASPWEDRAFT_186159 [Aspergillus wentii DTO 134E9]|uniref:Secreted protein n=1 Tax=Aspergillus wentii DTO 134E9 TaxID=1073089 RepID=A0A1L9RAN7_ASPWE|nr:uncharacterized protein ASPWEDRAFT_186159 [Aspergillus wentii DTO 134E9]OJJ31917.1 hypothetical protein ASPWEDRAFT_186159 [Aspergillus wentii DTO 134E9]